MFFPARTCAAALLMLAFCLWHPTAAPAADTPQVKEVRSTEPESERIEPEGYTLIRDEYSLDTQDGKRIGHTHARIYSRETPQGTLYLSRYWSESIVLRESDVARSSSAFQVIEDARGKVISFRNVDMEPGSEIVIQGQIVGNKMHVTNNGIRKTYVYPEGMIGPRAYDELQRTRTYKEGDTYKVTVFESSSPDLPDVIEHKVVGKIKKIIAPIPALPTPVSAGSAEKAPGEVLADSSTPAPAAKAESKGTAAATPAQPAAAPAPSPVASPSVVQGKEYTVWHVDETHSLIPRGKIGCYITEKGEILMSEADFPGLGFFQSILCTREDTLKPFTPTDSDSQNDIVVTPGLPNFKSLKMARYEISAPGGKAEGPAMVLEGPEQRILARAEGKVEIEVLRRTFASASVTWKLPFAPSDTTSQELRDCLAAAPYIEINPAIRELSARALQGETNPVKATRAIERFVRSYITNKTYSTGFLSAADTARAKAGDCTEHAVLCAALARAAGLPARIVVGLGYLPRDYTSKEEKDATPQASGIFGFHMWAEAYIGDPTRPGGDDWQPMDAALDGFDVGHIAVLRTALNSSQSMLDLTSAITQFMGKLSIKVLETK
ncbi:hypothetical protein DB346_20140 [Verrucomicrobia bacterium LW23]|nr:hypothetical protein DB346_20140 [Verrucomicrobia bacterium LW23]